MEEKINTTESYKEELLEQSKVYAEKYEFPEEVDKFHENFDFEVSASLRGEKKEDTSENKLLKLHELDKDAIARNFATFLKEDKELLDKETTSDFDVEKSQIEEVKKMAKQNYDFGDSTTEQFVKNYQDILIMEHDNLRNISKFDAEKNELTINRFSKDSPNNIRKEIYKTPKGIKNKSDALKHYAHAKMNFKNLAEKTTKTEMKTRFKATLETVRERLIGEERGNSKKVGNNQKMKM